MPKDFENLKLDGLKNTGAVTSAITEPDCYKIQLIANEAKQDSSPPPNFSIMMANCSNRNITTQIRNGWLHFTKNFINMETLLKPLMGFCFLCRNKAVFDVTQGILTFRCFSMQLKQDTQVTLRQSTPLFVANTYTPTTRRNSLHSKQIAPPVRPWCNRNSHTFTTIRKPRQRFHHIVI